MTTALLTTAELEAAIYEMILPEAGFSGTEWLDAEWDYTVRFADLQRKWQSWLAYMYASGVPAQIQDRIYERAWDSSDDYTYAAVEARYKELASHAIETGEDFR